VCGRVAVGGSDSDDNGDAGAGGQPPAGAFPKAFAWLTGKSVMRLEKTFRRGRPHLDSSAGDDWRHEAARIGQLFSSDLIRLSNSSNEVSPLIISPLMKKVGVEFTFSTSLAYF